MVYLMLLDEGEEGLIIPFLLLVFIPILFVGLIVPIGAAVTCAIYHFRLHYKFTWIRNFIKQEES